MSSEKLSKYFVKYLIRTNLKFTYKLCQVFSSYLSFIFRFDVKTNTNCKQLVNKLSHIFLDYKVRFSFKFLISNIKLNSKYSLLFNLNQLLMKKRQIYSKLFEHSRLLLFYRW